MNQTFIEYEEGNLKVQERDFDFLSHGTMHKYGLKLWVALPPGWKVRVTGGPYRDSDVNYRIIPEEKVVVLDFYSVRPGIGYMDELIHEVVNKINRKYLHPEPSHV